MIGDGQAATFTMLRHYTLAAAMLLAASASAAEQPLLPPDWDAGREGDRVLERLVRATGPEVKGAHDASLEIVDGRAYVVAEVNDRQAGEAASWPDVYVALSIVDLQTMRVENVQAVARGGQRFENETLPVGACFVPRIVPKDERTLRCFFASEQPGKRQSQTWYVDFDLKGQTLRRTIHRAKIKTAAGTFDLQPQYFHADAVANGFTRPPKDYGLYLFDWFRDTDGRLFVAMNNWPGKQNALTVANDALDTFEVLGHYNEPPQLATSESAVNRLPDGSWIAICRQDGGKRNYTFTTSRDGKRWTPNAERPFVPNGTNSKPTLDRFGGVYYLGWQEATQVGGAFRSVFNVDVSRDGTRWERKYRFATDKSFQYPTFCQYDRAVYLVVTQGDHSTSRKERIMFGRLETIGTAGD